jgi:arabinogalactan oligomer / maltooligosaccharide transport system permease protein
MELEAIKGIGEHQMTVTLKNPFVKKQRRTSSNFFRHAFAWLMIAFSIFPIYVVITSSLSTSGALSQSIIPAEINWGNYERLFTDEQVPFLTWMGNSLLLATVNAVLSVLIGILAAFAFSRLKYKGRKQSLQVLLLVQVFPNFLALAAIYVIMERIYRVFPEIGLGTLGGLLLVYLGASMGANAWLLKGFLDSIPMELDEAAKIDGASPAQIFWQVFLPLTTPILIVVALLSFIGTFNEFILASIFLQDIESRTIAVGLQSFVSSQFGQNWGAFAAGSVLASIPLVALFLSLQKYIVGGVTSGAVKG